MAFNNGFTYRRKLTFANATLGVLEDVPIFLELDDSAGGYPGLEAYNNISFTDKYGTALSWGLKEFADGGSSWYGFNVPFIANNDSDYGYVYYGGTTSVEAKSSVHDSNTVLVTPMVDYGDTSHIEDWTGVNTLTKKGAGEPASASGGSLGTCQDFDGSDDYISTPNPGGTYSAMTYEIYAQLPGFTGTSRDIMRWDYGTTAGPLARLYSLGDTALLYFKTSEGTVNDSLTFTADSWYYFGQKWTGSKLYRIFNNTIDSESSLAGSVAPNDAIYVGAYNATTNRYNGLIGLIRISNTARSDNWLKAQDKILRTQDYVTIGEQETSASRTKIIQPSTTYPRTTRPKVKYIS